MFYDVTGHPLLSVAAVALGVSEPDALTEQNELAEDVLGLSAVAQFTGDDALRATRAVALQVNYQIEQGIDAAVYQSVARGSRNFDYRVGIVHPVALEVASTLIANATTSETGGWSTIQSLR